MEKTSKILVTGGTGLIGSALVRLLKAEGYERLYTPPHRELDLRDQKDVNVYFETIRPDYVFHLAAHVGGIQANHTFPGQFIYNNTMMHSNVLYAARKNNVAKLLFPGSACAYPRDAEQPIKESAFLTGAPEPTNIAYAAAKINGIVMAQSYAKEYGMNVVLPMVANTYGPGDRSSHVIPELMKKFKGATDDVVLLGTGGAIREFIYSDDVADAFLFLMKNYDSLEIINVGTQEEVSINKLANKISSFYNFNFDIGSDPTHPDGSLKKVLDSSKLYAMGWKPKVNLDEGLRRII